MHLSKRAAAEFFGTFWLVFGGCGSAVLAAAFPSSIPGVNFNIGFVGVALAFGLTVLTMAFAIGHISGCHPQSRRLGRPRRRQALPYLRASRLRHRPGRRSNLRLRRPLPHRQRQARLLPRREASPPTATQTTPPAGTPSLPASSPRSSSPPSSSLSSSAPPTRARAQGLRPHRHRTLPHPHPPHQHPVTNTSVNPARSTGPALFVGGWAISQLWLFWVAPIVGAIIGGLISDNFFRAPQEPIREAMSKN